ncbi:probable protein phosphatase 2C T23F11.1 [Aphidius gifuensis]|nr:probable protein phosphatase 2C T23F11.1 [Aphidius gifuensis]XP_044001197.1 probable protein phosphatase 2C T23F11.1 [Aphidius gifuensis]
MGQTLSEPVTTKISATCRDDNYLVGSSCMQGWRIKMEDCHVHILSLPDDPGTSFFAVYDGHGGATTSQHAGKHLHEYITKTDEYKEGKIIEAMQQGFLQLDKAMQSDSAMKTIRSGTTVIACLIKDNILYCANAGDSRAVACVCGEVVPLSRDHKPSLTEERTRIEAAGGWVQFNRVNGHLALSRALGDFMFKDNKSKNQEEQIVTAFPEVQKHNITEDWEFVILACDGIWDVMSSSEVIEFIRNYIATLKNFDKPIYPDEICEELLDHCLAPDALMGTGCDNMTVVLVCFLHGKPSTFLELQCQRPSKDQSQGTETRREENIMFDDEGGEEEEDEDGDGDGDD